MSIVYLLDPYIYMKLAVHPETAPQLKNIEDSSVR